MGKKIKKESNCDILIVGAGLAGLSAAWHLKDKGKIRIIEKADFVGGYSATKKYQGFFFDFTGHLLHLRDSKIKKWIIKDLFENKIDFFDRKSRVWSWDVYTNYPFQANTYGLPERVAKECVDEYLTALKNKKRKEDIKTAEEFILNHFGKGFARHFLIPYNRKIWGIHPRNLSADWGERFIPIPKKEEVLAGSRPGNQLKLGYNSQFYYPQYGIGELPNKIHTKLKKHCKVELDTELLKVEILEKKAYVSSGEVINYRYLVNTSPLKDFVTKVVDGPRQLKNSGKLLKSKDLNYLNIGLNIPCPKNFHWCYIPSLKIPFYRVGVYSNFSKKMAPRGHSSLYVEFARDIDNNLISKAIDELIKMDLITKKNDIKFIKKEVIKNAYVIYDRGYDRNIKQIHSFLLANDIHSIGRWGAWNYSSMEDAIIMGRELSNKIKKNRCLQT